MSKCWGLSLAPICFALIFALLLGGCGKKTPPVPPDTVLPAPIDDLRYELNEKGVTLQWTYPTRTVRGERLPYRIKEFEVYRAVLKEEDFCPGCPVTFEPPISIEAEFSEADKTVRFTETLLRPDYRYIYQVKSKDGWFITSAESNAVSFYWGTPPGAPSALQLTIGDRSLGLSWQAPTNYIDGTPISEPLFYRVYRALPNTDFSPVGDVLEATTYTDNTVSNGIEYNYRVRAVRVLEKTKIAGPPSSVQSGVPQDRTAPLPPQHVTVVGSEAGVKVYWQAVTASDLAGYRIYRRGANTEVMQFVGEVGQATLTFIDKSPLTGAAVWHYAVTSFDAATPANESTFSKETVFQVIR